MNDGMIGEVRLFGGNFAPRNWAFCDGQLLAISQNDALFSILGTIYGGDGRTTFALPDLRGRVAVQHGQGAGLTNLNLGQKTGVETEQINANQLPAHSHTIQDATWAPQASNAGGTSDDPVGNIFARAEDAAGTKNVYATPAEFDADSAKQVEMIAPELDVTAVGQAGGGANILNRQPFLGMRYIICTLGTYPSRT